MIFTKTNFKQQDGTSSNPFYSLNKNLKRLNLYFYTIPRTNPVNSSS